MPQSCLFTAVGKCFRFLCFYEMAQVLALFVLEYTSLAFSMSRHAINVSTSDENKRGECFDIQPMQLSVNGLEIYDVELCIDLVLSHSRSIYCS